MLHLRTLGFRSWSSDRGRRVVRVGLIATVVGLLALAPVLASSLLEPQKFVKFAGKYYASFADTATVGGVTYKSAMMPILRVSFDTLIRTRIQEVPGGIFQQETARLSAEAGNLPVSIEYHR